MKKEKQTFKHELSRFTKKIPYEIFISLILGAVPVTIYSTNAKAFEEIVNGLLAIGALIDYAGYLIILYALATLTRYAWRFISENAQNKLVAFHKMTTEIGTSFLTIVRTGLGTMMGILIVALTSNVIILTSGDYAKLISSIICVLIASSCVAFLHELLAKAAKSPQYDNPLKFDKNLLR